VVGLLDIVRRGPDTLLTSEKDEIGGVGRKVLRRNARVPS